MAEFRREWQDGGSLTATYGGSGDGSAIFSSDAYEGIDREMPAIFKDTGNHISVERTVRQEGKRQQFRTKDGLVFRVKGGGRFGVLRGEKPYTEVEYIESTGTQWIDTGVKLTGNHSVEIDYQFTKAVQNRKGLFGGLYGSGTTMRYGALLSPSNSYLEFGYGLNNTYWQHGLPDTQRHVYKQVKNKVYFDSELVHTFAESTFSIAQTAVLGNFSYTNYKPANAKYYGSKWWDGDTLIRDFIPVLDKEGIACMYDKVNGEFFYNQGTGDFIVGYKNK